MLSKEASSTIFESLVWLDLGLNPSLPAIGEHYIYIGLFTNNNSEVLICHKIRPNQTDQNIYRSEFLCQTLKMISQVESFLCPDKQGTPEKGRRIQRPKRWVTTKNYKDEDNSPKNHTQNIAQSKQWSEMSEPSWEFLLSPDLQRYLFQSVSALTPLWITISSVKKDFLHGQTWPGLRPDQCSCETKV